MSIQFLLVNNPSCDKLTAEQVKQGGYFGDGINFVAFVNTYEHLMQLVNAVDVTLDTIGYKSHDISYMLWDGNVSMRVSDVTYSSFRNWVNRN